MEHPVSTHSVRLQARDEIAEGTMAFHFEKPAGFEFKPGQAIEVVLTDPGTATDPQDTRHAFSIVSAPFQNELVIATRMRDSAFKRALRSLPIGAQVVLDGPFGSLGLHKNRARAGVFIAGGIGITPFVSMLRQAAKDQLPQDLVLLYSSRRPEDAAFLSELQQMAAQHGRFQLITTMTQMQSASQPWAGRTGLITGDFVRDAVVNLAAPIFYIAGPPAMVEAMRQTLVGAGIDEDEVRSEAFYGY